MLPPWLYLPVQIIIWVAEFGLDAIIVAIIIRVFASWFQLDERFAIIRFLARLTDPFLQPLRRIMPRIGVFDVSFIIALVLLRTIQVLLLQAL